MLGIDRRAARAVWTVFLFALLLVLLYLVRHVILVFIAAVLFAYLLAPVVNLANRISARHVSHTWALGAVYVLLVGLLVFAGVVVGGRVSEQAASLIDRFPKLIEGFQARLASPESGWLAPATETLASKIREKTENIGSLLLPVLQTLTGGVASVVGGAIVVVMVPVLSFFFLKDAGVLRDRILGAVAAERRAMWDGIFSDLHRLLGQFIRALVLLATATFIAYGAFFAIIGVRYALLLASVAAVLEFIPVLGPLAAAAIIVAVAAISGQGPIWVILAFLGAYRLFQDYVLQPQVMGAGMELHPLLIIFGALAGEAVAGIPGMFLSVPVMAALRILWVRLQQAGRPAFV